MITSQMKLLFSFKSIVVVVFILANAIVINQIQIAVNVTSKGKTKTNPSTAGKLNLDLDMRLIATADKPKSYNGEPALSLGINNLRQLENQHQTESKNGKKSRVRLVTLLFGETVVHSGRFRLFIMSCATAGVDFAIVGDYNPPFALPENVKYYRVTWDDLTNLVHKSLFNGTDPSRGSKNGLRNAGFRKINDFKPLTAFLWPELVAGYEWWGSCDNDMLFGNLTKFLLPEFLDNFDIISGNSRDSKHHTWGPFTPYRNVDKVNTIFLHADPPEDVKLTMPVLEWLFAYKGHHFFDEWYDSNEEKRSMASISGIIGNHAKRLGIRHTKLKGHLLWDKLECLFFYEQNDTDTSNVPDRCGECVLNKNGTLVRSRDAQEIYLCHFHRTKKLTADPRGKLLKQLLKRQELRVTYKYGYDFLIDNGPHGQGLGAWNLSQKPKLQLIA